MEKIGGMGLILVVVVVMTCASDRIDFTGSSCLSFDLSVRLNK